MTSKGTRKEPPPSQMGGEEELRHYTPEQVYEKKLSPFAPRTLRERASAGIFPHSIAGGRIEFRLCHLREIADMYEVRPISETKPLTKAA
ncbi:hypothetical protein [Streptomyces ehimensis]|uniref:Helix-turn-helix domain-containing protein n=1 Tax=Streptomyces ehimensis TaxID=68195 RepID=A0ABV9BF06_9ACTN